MLLRSGWWNGRRRLEGEGSSFTATVPRCQVYVEVHPVIYGSPVGLFAVTHNSRTGGSLAGATSCCAAGTSDTPIGDRGLVVGTKCATFPDRLAPCCVRTRRRP
jgi:hypothetical protein